MTLTGVVASATATVALIGSITGGVMWMENRYVTSAEFKNVEWGLLRRELRELEKELEDDPNDERLREDYEQSLDRYCLSFPEDEARCRNRSTTGF